jgi:hypothetical protein
MGAPAPPWGDLQYCKPFYTWGSTQILPTGALSRDKSRIISLRSLRTANPPNFNPPKRRVFIGLLALGVQLCRLSSSRHFKQRSAVALVLCTGVNNVLLETRRDAKASSRKRRARRYLRNG